jgi:hypothetical protein
MPSNNVNDIIKNSESTEDNVKNNIIAELLGIINNQKKNVDTHLNSVVHSQSKVNFMNYLMSSSSSICCLIIGCLLGYLMCKKSY